MKIYAMQWKLRLPALLAAGLGAGRFGLVVVFLLSGSFFAQAQEAEPAPAVSV